MDNVKVGGFSLAKGKELIGDDAFLIKKYNGFTLGVVCDGVGSAKEGREAARRVIKYLDNSFSSLPVSWDMEKSIKHFITSINKILYNEGIQNYERPEFLTTLALTVIKGNRLYGANVGDSRIYLYRDRLYQLSIDHNNPYDSSCITEAIGMKEEVGIYYFENNLEVGDKVLLCSDGIYEVLNEEEIAKNLFGASHIVRVASKKTNDNLPDDTTAVVIEINNIDKSEELKKINLPIIKELKAGMEIDGFILNKSLIQNNRTWLAIKKIKNMY